MTLAEARIDAVLRANGIVFYRVGANLNEDRVVTKWGGQDDSQAQNLEYLHILKMIAKAVSGEG